MPDPTATGRAIAILLGCVLGGAGSLYMFSDYQIIQRLDDPNEVDENGKPIERKFNVRFRPTQPLKLKPEAEKRYSELREKAIRAQEELAQVEQTSNKKE